jgi:hypothetical protein
MKISCNRLSNEITKLWPYMNNGIMIPDGKYWAPSLKKVYNIITKTKVNELKYDLEWFDCDDFALVLHSSIIRQRYKKIKRQKLPKKQWLPWSFGQVWLTKVKGEKTSHAINICYTSDSGLLLIEPQTDEIWKAHKKKDNPFFIRI